MRIFDEVFSWFFFQYIKIFFFIMNNIEEGLVSVTYSRLFQRFFEFNCTAF